MALKMTKTALAMALIGLGLMGSGCNSSDEEPGATPAATGAVTLDPDTDETQAQTPYRTGETEAQGGAVGQSNPNTRTTDAGTADIGSRISGEPSGEHEAATTSPAQSMVTALHETVSFEGSSANLTEDSIDRLKELAQQVEQGSPIALSVQVQNYTASTSVETGSDVLAEQRAAAIKNILESEGAEVAGWKVDTLAGDAGAGVDLNPAMTGDQQSVVIAIVNREGEVSSTTTD